MESQARVLQESPPQAVLRVSKTAYVINASTQTYLNDSTHDTLSDNTSIMSAAESAAGMERISSARTPIYKPKTRKRKHTPRKITQFSENEEFEEEDVRLVDNAQADGALSQRPSVVITNMVDCLVNGSDVESSNLESCIVSTDKNVAVSAASSIKRERLSPYNDRLMFGSGKRTASSLNSNSASQSPVSINQSYHQQQVDEEYTRGRFKCLLCHYANNHKIALDLHSVVHEGSGPYTCKRCLFVTEDAAELNHHVKQHTGEQRFHCTHPGCEYSSNNSSNLKRHSRSHRDTSKLSAEEPELRLHSDDSSIDINIQQDSTRACSAETQQNLSGSLLGQLASVVNGINTTRFSVIAENLPETPPTDVEILQCDQCEYHTTNPTNLRRHKIKHRAHPSHRCTVCSYTTNYLGNMRRHFEVRHKGIPFDKSLTESPQPRLMIPEMLSSLKTLDWLTAANAIKRSAMEENGQALGHSLGNPKQQRLEDIPDLKPFISRLPLSREDNSSSLALLQQMVLQHHT